MIGAIAGDIIGSVYEWDNLKSKEFELFIPSCRFTDDSVLTVAVGESILLDIPVITNLKHYYWKYPDRGYGGGFQQWASSSSKDPYNSWGNGAAMRISPVGFAFDDLPTVLEKAEEFTAVTHNHPEGIRGAQATAAAIFHARNGSTKEEIKRHIESFFDYDLSVPIEKIRPTYEFDVSCQGTVPPAIRAFLESTDFEDAIRNAISIGGDSDTIACITGGIAHAFYGIPSEIEAEVYSRLDADMAKTCKEFMARFPSRKSKPDSQPRVWQA